MASIIQQISLQADSESISATSYTAIANIIHRYWDADLYDGTAQVYFEATLDPVGATRTIYAALYDGAGNQVSGSEISLTGTTTPTLVRSGAITLSDNTEYHVRAKRAVGNGILAGCRLVVKQSGTITKTATYIDLATLPDGTTGGNYGYVASSCSWLHDADMYDGITAIYFEAEVKHSTGAYTQGTELYNKTNSAQVVEVGTNSTSYNRQRSADIKASIADAKEYAIRHKDGGGGTGYTAMGSIIIVQQNFTKSCSLISVSQYASTTSPAGIHIPIYFEFTKADWSCPTLTAKFFAHAYGGGATDVSFGVILRPWNTTDNLATLSYAGGDLSSGTVPTDQAVDSVDSYSSLAASQDYRVLIWAADLEATASLACFNFGLQVEFTLPIDRTLTASGSSCSITGTAAGLKKSSTVGAGVGSYSTSGTAATLTHTLTGPTLNAEIGSYVLTGTAAWLTVSHTLAVGATSYGISGASVGLCSSRVTGAGFGLYTVSGTGVTLSYIRNTITLSAESADFYIMGPIGGKTLKKSLSLVPASSGSIAVTGTAAGFLYSHVLAASSGSYAVTGTAATFLYSRILGATAGSYTVTGTAVDFVAGMGIAATTGSFAVTGTAAGLCKSHIFSVTEGAFTVTGTAATFDQTKGITASSGTFALSGTAAGLLKDHILVTDPDKSSTVITRYVADAWEGEFAQASLTATWTPTDLPDDIAIVCFGLDSRAEIASVNLGGRAFTKLASVEGTGSGYHRGELWYLVSPPHVESEFSITLNDSQGTWTIYRVEHYYNVNQYDPFGDVAATFAAGKYNISGTVEDVLPGQFPFDWIVNTIAWYALTPGVDQTEIFNLNTGHFARGMSHRFGDTGDLAFSWSFPGIAGDNVHIATVFKQPAFRNTFTIDGTAATLLKIVEMTIHDATHGITMSGTVLIVSAAQLLVIDDSAHALTMGNVTLTMPGTLTINDAVHVITMQNAGLVMPGALTINEAVHAVTMPNIALGGIAYGGLDAMINIGGAWKDVNATQVQVGGAWKDVTGITLRQ
jgi:hypothetical protein